MANLADGALGVAHAQWFTQHKRRWPLCLMVFVCAALGVYSVLVGIGQRTAARRLPVTKAQVLALAPPPVPDAKNAAVVWKQAFRAMKRWTGQGRDDPTRIRTDWSNRVLFATGSPIRAYLQDNKEAFAFADKAAILQRCNWNCDYGQGHQMPMVHLGPLREIVRLCALRARVAAFDNDWPLVERTLRTAGCAADHALTDNTLLTMLFAIAADAISAAALEDCISIPGSMPDDKAIEGLTELLNQRLRVAMPHADALETDRLFSLLFCDELGTGINQAAEIAVPGGLTNSPVLFNWCSAVCSSDRAAADANYSAAIVRLRQTQPNNAELDTMAKEMDRRSALGRARFHLISSMLMPVVFRCGTSVNCRSAQLRLSFMGLSAYGYCRSHGGKWPESLEQLVRDKAVLQDPCGTLQSRLQSKVDPKDGSLWLWSVGNNGKDDSDPAKYKGKDFLRYWREKDVVFHVPRSPQVDAGEQR